MESEHVHDAAAAEGIPADGVDGSFVPVARPDAVAVEFDGETVLVDAVHMQAHRLDRVGTIVWDCFDGVSSIDELSADLADAFGAPVEAVTEDVLELVRNLGQAGLLAGIEPRHAHSPATPTGLAVGTELADLEVTDLADSPARLST